ncbi:hypothetical protein RW092_03190 [Paenibacillus sp. 3LSP]|uniref:hypothetical protein n=1 Tax=Paenibacillus sp. 3LSP TaxID=2800795 RepID=UPI0028FD47DD|nr:hypothetical protein [Paenibacillus sp. 3LSP]MDU0329207.1 hypothetical protein [Paenibacillus sp. 3LSP]
MTPEQIKRLIDTYHRAPVDGSSSTFWDGEGKEAYQDGFMTALDLLGVKIEDINA